MVDEKDEVPESHWNHRVVRQLLAYDQVRFRIHEVYYTKGVPDKITQDGVEPMGETLDELRLELKRYTEALDNPVLNFEDF